MGMSYKVVSANTLVKMAVTVEPPDGLRVVVPVDVDYASGKVYLSEEALASVPGVDPGELEADVLRFLVPTPAARPALPDAVMRRVAEVKAGNHGGRQ